MFHEKTFLFIIVNVWQTEASYKKWEALYTHLGKTKFFYILFIFFSNYQNIIFILFFNFA